MRDDDLFYMKVLDGLDPRHTPPGLLREAVQEAVDHLGAADLSDMIDQAPSEQRSGPDDRRNRLSSAKRKEVLRYIAASSAVTLMDRTARELPKLVSLGLAIVFLRIGIADMAGQRITMTDILREDAEGFGPERGSPIGKEDATLVEQTIRNSYIVKLGGLVTTFQGEDSQGRNQYLVLTPEGRRIFRRLVGALST